MRASAASTTAVALASPDATAAAISDADAQGCMGLDLEHRGRLGLVVELELGDQSAEAQGDSQVGLHRRLPFRLDGQGQRLGSRVDVSCRGGYRQPACAFVLRRLGQAERRPNTSVSPAKRWVIAALDPTYVTPADAEWPPAAHAYSRVSGADSTRSVGPCSTIAPERMTMTRSHKRRTTLRSCETNR